MTQPFSRGRLRATAIAVAAITLLQACGVANAAARYDARQDASREQPQPQSQAQGGPQSQAAAATQRAATANDALVAASGAPLASMPVHASDIDRVEIFGWTVESNSIAALSAATSNLTSSEANAAQVDGADGARLATFLQARALKGGFVSMSTLVNKETRTIALRLLAIDVQVSGTSENNYRRLLARYDGTAITSHELEGKFQLIQHAAAINGDRVNVSLNNPTDDARAPTQLPGTPIGLPQMPLVVDAQPTGGKTWGGAVDLSPYGQRYSGRDTVTASLYGRVADAMRLDFSASKGIPGLRSDSRGGGFSAESLGVESVTREGIFTGRASFTDFKQGGPQLRDYDINGNIVRFDGQFERPLTSSLSAFGGLSVLNQKQSIGAADLNDRQTLLFAQGGVNYQQPGFAGSVRVMQGLAGSESYNVAPIAGAFDKNFTALAGDATWSKYLAPKWTLDATLSAQVGSGKTPSSVGFYGGGLYRARAFTTGNIAGSSGVAGSLTVNREVWSWLTAYGFAEAALVHSSGLASQNESDIGFGVRTPFVPVKKLHTSFSLDANVSQSLTRPAGESKSPTFNVRATFAF